MNKIANKLIILTIVLGFALSACTPKATGGASEQKGTIAISGAFALYPMMQRWVEEYNKINPDVLFDVSAGGAGKGMTDALSGAVEIGMVSRAISADEEALGAYWVPVVIDAVFPTINTANPVLATLLAKPMTQEVFSKIFISGEFKTWGDVVGDPSITDEIHVYTRSDACGAADTWAKYLGGKQEDLLGIGISSDPGLLDAVKNDPLGIGYNNLNYAFDTTTGKPVTGTLVVPIDVNGDGTTGADEYLETTAEAVQAVADGKYPSPPARELNLVTKGKPAGIVKSFIIWTLTDGQKFVNESGYITLTEAQLTDALAKVK
jgi:phosphate transport system substrate-binding protein